MAAIAAPDAAPKSGDKAPAPVNPFTRASRRKTRQFLDRTQALGAGAVNLQQVELPATGFLRHIVLDVECTGAVGAVYVADGPWSVIDQVTLTDVGGSNAIVQLSGFELFVANLYGGYTQNSDPRKLLGYAATATGFRFQLRIPVEIIQRNAFGALPNLNSAMTYKLRIALAAKTAVFSAEGAGSAPTVQVRAMVESWGNPPAADLRGAPNATTPPALGTTQNWSTQVVPTVTGRNTPRLARVGHSIRNIIFIQRDAAGARTDAPLPDDLQLLFDGNEVFQVPVSYLRKRTQELYGAATADLLAGVIVLAYTDDFDATPGQEIGDFYMDTTGATALELQGTWKAAGSLHIITNDILASVANTGAGATLGTQG